jgi:aryl-alcohol dehydrogenase-like predicted oxidoreductase
MEYRKLGPSNLEVSAVGLGTWALGNDFFGDVDDETSVAAIQAALDSGVNLVDTAPAYGAGHAEEVVGRALRGRREAAVIATKAGIRRTEDDFVRDLRPESVREEIDDSLRRLQVDTIDLYQIHWPDPNTPLEETLDALQKIQESGKFRYLGVSNADMGYMDQVQERMELVSLQPHYSLIHRGIEKRILPYCRERNLGVIGYGTLAGGILTGKFSEIPEFEEGDYRDHFYGFFKEPLWSKIQELLQVLRDIAEERDATVAQIAINWAAAQEGITSVLVGAKHPDQARANAAAGQWYLTAEELERINAAHRSTIAAPA